MRCSGRGNETAGVNPAEFARMETFLASEGQVSVVTRPWLRARELEPNTSLLGSSDQLSTQSQPRSCLIHMVGPASTSKQQRAIEAVRYN
jgi:hypothetical protein